MAGPLSTNTTMATAAINISPPMVGVPCLDMCQVGPSSLMAWPAFHRRRAGTKYLPSTALMTKPRITAARVLIRMESIPLHLRVFQLRFSLFWGPPPFSPGGRARRTYIIAYSVGKRKQFLLFRPDGPAGCRSPARSHGPCPPAESRPPPVPWTGPAGWRPAGPAAGPRR